MTKDELQAKLDEVKDQINAEFNGNEAHDRLQIFNAHMSTVKMNVDHLFDEAERIGGYRA